MKIAIIPYIVKTAHFSDIFPVNLVLFMFSFAPVYVKCLCETNHIFVTSSAILALLFKTCTAEANVVTSDKSQIVCNLSNVD